MQELTIQMDIEVDKSASEMLLGEVGAAAFERLSGIFIEECDRNCAEIVQFLEAEDLSGAEIVAHRFKSTARQFGVHGLADLCRELERACAEGEGEQSSGFTDILTSNMPQIYINFRKTAARVLENS